MDFLAGHLPALQLGGISAEMVWVPLAVTFPRVAVALAWLLPTLTRCTRPAGSVAEA